MTHEDYLSRIETFSDSAEEASAVLAHVSACASCREERRAADEALARLDPKARFPIEEITRWCAAAAIVALVVAGVYKETHESAGMDRPGPSARYTVVGDASGVVAYTPEGVVVGVSPRRSSFEKETAR